MTQALSLALKSFTASCIDSLWRSEPAICENVKEWSLSQPETVAKLLHEDPFGAKPFQQQLPNTIEPEIHSAFLKHRHNTAPEKYLACLTNVELIGHQGLIVLPDGSYTAEPMMDAWNLRLLPEYYNPLRKRLYQRKQKAGKYFSLLQRYANNGNYYHWLHDVLQKFYKILELIPQDVQIIVPNNLKEWQYEALSVLGLSRDRLIPYPGHEIWEIETLYFTPFTALLEYDTPGAGQWLQQLFYQ